MTSDFCEHDFLQWLRERLPQDLRLKVPVGDDAALIKCQSADVLVAQDAVVEGRHVAPGPNLPEEMARKVLRANLSDLAAMGGRAEALLLTLLLPLDHDSSWPKRITETLLSECATYGLAFAGGDTVIGGSLLVLSATVLGYPIGKALRRGGAQLDDLIVVTGELGGSILGKHVDFQPRLLEAERLLSVAVPNAMTDITDGFLRDLANIVEASDLGAVLHANSIPIAPAAMTLASRDGSDALEHALHDGEDFELIFTMAEERFQHLEKVWNMKTKLHVVGRVVESGLWMERRGRREPLFPGGFDHGRHVDA